MFRNQGVDIMKHYVAMSALGAAIFAAGSLAFIPEAQADERVCRGTIGKVVVDGDVRVAPGATCTLAGTTVKGNVYVSGRSTLTTRAARVNGNIQAENHTRVVLLTGTIVGGSVQLKQGGSARIESIRVNGDVQLFSNRGTQTVNRNTIGGNLQCKSNVPAPTGTGNRVGGNKEDQCARL